MDQLNMVLSLADQNNAWSAAQAQKQMDFQERMSNTAHQREIADLKASGLNPVLSAKLGGASTPSGASATADSSVIGAVVEILKEFSEGMMSSAASGFARGSSDAEFSLDDLSRYKSDDVVVRNGQHYKVSDMPEYQINSKLKAVTDVFVPKKFKSSVNAAIDYLTPGLTHVGSKLAAGADKLGSSISKALNGIYDKASSSAKSRYSAAIKDYKSNPMKYW